MGLDLLPVGRPKKGFEDEYNRLWNLISGLDGNAGPTDADFDRYQKITIDPYEDLGAPKVGRDPEAERLLRAAIASGDVEGDNPDQVVRRWRGLYFTHHLKRPSALIPLFEGGRGITSFRGQLLEWLVDVVGESLVSRAWADMNAQEALMWADKLEAALTPYAARTGTAAVLETPLAHKFDESNDESAHNLLLIGASAILYMRSWASLGHGFEADF